MHHSVTLSRRATARTRHAAVVLAAAVLTACTDEATRLDPTATAPVSAAVMTARGDSIPGAYIVRFRASVNDAPGLAKQLVGQHGGRLTFSYTRALKGFAVANLPAQAVTALQRNPNVEAIEPDRIASVDATQSPTPSWGLDRLDQTAPPLNSTYTYANDGSGVNVYILDTGIRTTHSEFGGRAVSGFNAVPDANGSNDCQGHGTHVAGTVGGTNYGVAKGVKLWAVRVLDCTGSGQYSWIIAGIDWVTANRQLPAVANMSLGGGLSSSVNLAVQNSIKAGVVYAIAAGNSAADACNYTPAATPEAITVGSTGRSDGMSGFSNWGSCVDIFGPGESIVSSSFSGDNTTATMSGTSMATPHAAGVAALMLSANPALTPAQVAATMTSGATTGLITGLPSNTVNRLLTSNVATGTPVTPPPTTDPTTPPPPPPPAVDAPPVASFTASCPRGRCTFDASSSTDDRGIASYRWDFGDGSAAQSGSALSRVTYKYTRAGSYTVTLTITDTAGQTSTRTLTVSFKRV